MATKTARVAMAATAINAFAPRNVGGLADGNVASLFLPRIKCNTTAFLDGGLVRLRLKVHEGQNDPLRPW